MVKNQLGLINNDNLLHEIEQYMSVCHEYEVMEVEAACEK